MSTNFITWYNAGRKYEGALVSGTSPAGPESYFPTKKEIIDTYGGPRIGDLQPGEFQTLAVTTNGQLDESLLLGYEDYDFVIDNDVVFNNNYVFTIRLDSGYKSVTYRISNSLTDSTITKTTSLSEDITYSKYITFKSYELYDGFKMTSTPTMNTSLKIGDTFSYTFSSDTTTQYQVRVKKGSVVRNGCGLILTNQSLSSNPNQNALVFQVREDYDESVLTYYYNASSDRSISLTNGLYYLYLVTLGDALEIKSIIGYPNNPIGLSSTNPVASITW